MNGWERMLAEQRDEIERLRRKVDQLERGLSGMFYRVTSAISFAYLVIGDLPPPPTQMDEILREQMRRPAPEPALPSSRAHALSDE